MAYFSVMETNKKAVLITGAAKRLGATLVRTAVAHGYTPLLHCYTAEKEARALADELGVPQEHVLRANLSDPAEAAALVERAFALHPDLGGMIHNASHFAYDTLADVGGQGFDAHMAVNVRAPVLMTQAFARLYRRDAPACAVMLLDAKLSAPNPDYLSYTLSKAALAQFVELGAQALAGRVRVVGVAPTNILLSEGQDEANFARARALNLNGAPVMPQMIADAVFFVYQNAGINGITLPVDGGYGLISPARDVAFLSQTDFDTYGRILSGKHDSSQ